MPKASRPPLPDALRQAAAGAPGLALGGALLAWYDRHGRSLPWRPTRPDARDPYRTWLSEIMLQQTRVETVGPYYHRFLARFPTVQALAEAPLDEVLLHWSGLGYYSRARNLHAAARLVAAAGAFPDTVEGLRGLPGVGAYVAGAVASIAFGRQAEAVDGNVERVLSRLWAWEGGRQGVEALARAMLPPGRAGDFNQALMDLGSGVCTPRSPRCGECPLASGCRARAAGEVGRYPPPKAKKTVPSREAVALVLRRRGCVLLVRRPAEGLFGGLYELPGDFLAEGEGGEQAAGRVGEARLGLALRVVARLGAVDHVLTHMRLRLHVVEVEVAEEGLPALVAERAEVELAAPALALSWYEAEAWVDPCRPGPVGMSTLARKALAVVAGEGQGALFGAR